MVKNNISIIMIITLLSIYPSLGLLYLVNIHTFIYLFMLFCMIICIYITSLPLSIRIFTILFLLVFYQKNIYIVFNTINTVKKISKPHKAILRKNNDELRKIIRRDFSIYFKLHTDFEKLPNKPSILICNYCINRIENLASVLFPCDIVIVMRDIAKKYLFDNTVKWYIPIKYKNNYETVKKEILHHTSLGRYIFLYISIGFNNDTRIYKLRSGTFSIAKELNIPITMVCIDHIYTDIFGRIPYQNFRMKIGDTFYVDDIKNDIHKTRTFYQKTIKEFSDKKFEGIY